MGKKWSKASKNFAWRAQYFRIIHNVIFIYCTSFMVLVCKMTVSPGVIFIFFKILFSGIYCLSRSISKEWYISSFVVHKWKMIISPGIFFYFFKILIFWVVRRVKRQMMAQNDKKLRPLDFISQEPYMIWSWFLVHICKRIICPSVL